MAIVKVGTYRNPPEDITDYEAIVAHLEAYTRQIGNQGMILTEWTNTTNAPKIAMGSYISHGGVLYVVEDEDYVVTTAIDGYQYFRVWASGDTLIIDTVSSVVGYSWNAIYNGLYDVSGNQILPYQFNMNAGTGLYEKWKITNLMQGGGFSRVRYDGVLKCESLAVTGAISGASVAVTGNATVGGTLNGRSMVLAPHSSGAKEVFTAQLGVIRGLAVYNGDIYEGSSGGVVHRHDGTSETILSSVTLPHTVWALCFIDGDLVASDEYTVYRYSGFSNSLLSSFYTGSYVNGLAWDGTDLWIISYSTSAISHYDGFSSTKLESIGLVSILNAFGISRTYNVSGLVWTGKNFIFSVGLNTGSTDWNICALDKTNSYIVDAYNAYTDVGNSHVSGLALLDNFIYFGNYITGTPGTPQPIYRIPIRMVW